MWRFLRKDEITSKWPSLVAVMLARLTLVFLLVFLVAVMQGSMNPGVGIYVFMGVVFLITIPYSLWLREDDKRHAVSTYQFAVDVVIITGLVHFTGGINSQLSMLYPLVILAAGIVVSGRLALKTALLSAFLYATLITLEMSGALVYRGSGPFPYSDPPEVLQYLMLRILIFVFFAAASSYLADKCFYQTKQLERLRVIATAILDNVAIPLLAVFEDGRIMLANPAAATMLRDPREKITGRTINDFFPDTVPSLDSTQDALHIWTMRRADGSEFPVTLQVSRGNFPSAVLGSLADNPGGVDLYIVALRDMSDVLDASATGAGDVERTRTAAGMIAEMAHVVRNPLTAIRGAGEILNSAVDTMFERSREITESDWEAVKSMAALIHEQTSDLDAKVNYLLQCASDNPDKLKELIADAEKWHEKINPQGVAKHGNHSSG